MPLFCSYARIYVRYEALAPGSALVLVRRDIYTGTDDDDGNECCASARAGAGRKAQEKTEESWSDAVTRLQGGRYCNFHNDRWFTVCQRLSMSFVGFYQ